MFLSSGIALYHPLEIFIRTNQTDFVLHDLMGQPLDPINVKLYIEPGVEITASITANAAFRTGPMANGSTLFLINRGIIRGAGGKGGKGATGYSPSNGDNGSIGGDAVDLGCRAIIDNADGYIFSGGGGGGGGGCVVWNGSSDDHVGGGGGGGGAGDLAGAGESGGGSTGMYDTTNGSSGSTGNASNGGAGGNGGCYLGCNCIFAGDGGDGGDTGEAGQNGSKGAVVGCSFIPSEWTAYNGGAGGAAGKAIELNGHTIKWLAGNDAGRLKGDVS